MIHPAMAKCVTWFDSDHGEWLIRRPIASPNSASNTHSHPPFLFNPPSPVPGAGFEG